MKILSNLEPFRKAKRGAHVIKVLDITEDCPRRSDRPKENFLIIYTEEESKLQVYLASSTPGNLFGTNVFYLFTDIQKQVGNASSVFGTLAHAYGFREQALADIILQNKP